MNNNLKQAIKALEEKKVWYRVYELGGSGISSKDVEELIGVDLDSVFKTIVMTDGKNFFAAIVPGPSKVNLEKVGEVFNTKNLRLAKAKELKQNLHLAPGEVTPFILKIPIAVDKKIFEKEKIHFGSGDIHFGIEIYSKDLLKCINAKIENISE